MVSAETQTVVTELQSVSDNKPTTAERTVRPPAVRSPGSRTTAADSLELPADPGTATGGKAAEM